MGRAGRQIALWAVAAAVLLGASGLLLVVVIDRSGSGDDDDVTEQFAVAGVRATAVVDALTSEGQGTALDLLGAADLVVDADPDVANVPDLRSATDRSIDGLRTWLEGEGDARDDEVVGHYDHALDALAGLEALRAEIDAGPAATEPGSIGNVADAGQVTDRYEDLLAPLDEAQRAGVPLSTDDPGLRQGLILADTAARQHRLVVALESDLIAGTTDGGAGLDERAEITAVAERYGELTSNVEVIRGIDRSPYRELVASSFPDQLTADLGAAVEQALAGGPIDLARVLELGNLPYDLTYAGLREQARAETQHHTADLARSEGDTGPWLIVLTFTTGLALAALLALLLTISATRTRP
jgi:hypothetical protein